MGIIKPVVILAILSAALLFPEALATEPPPRVSAVKDASRSEPPQPQPKAGTDPQAAVKAAEAEAKDRADEKEPARSDVKADPAASGKPEVKFDARGKPVKPIDPPPGSKKPVKRRAVAAQLDDGMNPTYRPTLAPVAPMPKMAPHQAGVPVVPPGPVILNGCPNGACTDQSGQRYNPVGTTLISPQGRMCSNNGISVSCY